MTATSAVKSRPKRRQLVATDYCAMCHGRRNAEGVCAHCDLSSWDSHAVSCKGCANAEAYQGAGPQ